MPGSGRISFTMTRAGLLPSERDLDDHVVRADDQRDRRDILEAGENLEQLRSRARSGPDLHETRIAALLHRNRCPPTAAGGPEHVGRDDGRRDRSLHTVDPVDVAQDVLGDAFEVRTVDGGKHVPVTDHSDGGANTRCVLELDHHLLDHAGPNPQVDEGVHAQPVAAAVTRQRASSASAPSSGPTAINRSPAWSVNGPRGR